MSTPLIQWYPGHIAKAERQLQDNLKKVDVVLEVRDARIPLATHHPQVAQWIGQRDRILILNRVDMIQPEMRDAWLAWFRAQGEVPIFTDAQQGKGVAGVAKAAQVVGERINQRRYERGMLPRPVRAVVIGFPNVGKSALINRLLKKRVVESARKAGVTRQLRWVRISEQLELLDAPGVLPNKLNDQLAAVKLAICDDIGEAAYDNQRVAAAFIDRIKAIEAATVLDLRYGLDHQAYSGEAYLHALAEYKYQGDVERSARQLLRDFRIGALGAIALELPPTEDTLVQEDTLV